MRRLSRYIALAATLVGGQTAIAQQVGGLAAPCLTPDSVEFVGSTHRAATVLREDAGLPVGQPASSPIIQRAIKNLYATGQFDDVSSECRVVNGKTIYTFVVKDRPLLGSVDVTGVNKLSPGAVRDRVDLIIGRPVDPSQVAKDVSKIDSMYSAEGFYLAKVHVDTTVEKDGDKLVFRVDEGHRFAVSGLLIEGNKNVSDEAIVKSIETKPEGFFWWRKGEFDDDKYAGDLAQRIPQLYASKGYIDAQVLSDTMDVDHIRGKALIRLRVNEGPQYKVGTFEVNGGKRFSGEEIARYYPFRRTSRGLLDIVKGVIVRKPGDEMVFNQQAWDDATQAVRSAYANEGYLRAQVDPVIERTFVGRDSIPTVNLRWDISESVPSIVNRIDIKGNDRTSETCIRDQLFILPGDVFSQDRLMRSWQNISSLGFFESPLPAPDYKPAASDPQLLDLTFNVKEKHTGNVSFGASVGQGTGVGGFIGLDEPNMFGRCKRGSLQWQFGQFINDFNLSYQDPRLRGSRVSGQVSAYHSMSRFIIQDLGRTIRTGGDIRFGFPIASTRFTRLYLDYGGEKVAYGNTGLVSTINCSNCFRSTVGTSLEHDTQVGAPFPYTGVRQSVEMQFNGGPLGGTASFQRLLTSVRSNVTVAQFGGGEMGTQPVLLILSMTVKGGAIFGDPGPFFVSQAFTLGGTQYGEPLRGYDEFSITPTGFNSQASQTQAQRASFGNAFYTSSAELGLRLTSQLYVDAFYDAGNIWARPSDFDPTRLFRGAGVGGAIVTPLGPLGLDLGYGFDRTDILGRKAPKWQVHFKFGQLF
jgi:outer membrane protein insertion porin family